MKLRFARSFLFVVGLSAGTLRAAEHATAPATRKTPPPPITAPAADSTAPKPSAAPDPKSGSQSVTGMTRDFGTERKDRLALHKAQLERLNSAKTAEEKEKIIAEIRQQQQQRMERQRELARNIREQMQANRRSDTGLGAATAK